MSRVLFFGRNRKSSPGFGGPQTQPYRCTVLVAAISKTFPLPVPVEKLNDKTRSSVGCTDICSSTDDTRYGSEEPGDFRASHGERQRPQRARLVRPGKPAAVIALAICLVPIAMCGATGAPVTGPWFTLLRPKKSREAREKSAGRVRIRSVNFFIPSRAPHLGQLQRKDKS
jgi:hypothetical protein